MTEAANITDYYEADTFKRIKDFAEGKETPFVVIDTATIDRQYDELVEGFPYAKVYAEEIARFLNEDFGVELPEIIIEPGRSLISNAGVLVS